MNKDPEVFLISSAHGGRARTSQTTSKGNQLWNSFSRAPCPVTAPDGRAGACRTPFWVSAVPCWAQGQCHLMSWWLLGEVWSRADPSLEWSCSPLLQRWKLPWESGGRKYNTKITVRKSVCTAAVCYCDHIGESYWCDHLPHVGACGSEHWGTPGTPTPWPHIKGLCIWVSGSIQWKWTLIWFVSALTPQCLLCLSAGVSHLVWRVSRWWGWMIFLLGNGGLGLARNSRFQVKKRSNALPGTNIEQKFYWERESWTLPA